MNTRTLLVFTLITSSATCAAQVVVPACTTYFEPDEGGARIDRDGLVRWKGEQTSVNWYGQLKVAGSLSAAVEFDKTTGEEITLAITGQDNDFKSKLTSTTKPSESSTTVKFGDCEIPEPGYYRFQLTRSKNGKPIVIAKDGLILTGKATDGAHFNLKPRRNAASVHLAYPVSQKEITAFFCEMTADEDPLWSYYMACGWRRGYFGMQVNGPTERRIIFSVWDSGGEAVDRGKVGAEDRVTLIDKGDGVYSGDFGNEGTGGHSHLKFRWKTGAKQKFLITAEPVDETHTIYAGFYFHPDSHRWMLISAWKAPKDGKYLQGLYSFSENFVGRNGHVMRKARYGNQWIQTADGKWHEVTTAKFSHDVTGGADRLDRWMGTEGGQFFLQHGGFVDGFTKFGEQFERPATNKPPQDLPQANFSAALKQ